MKISFLIHTIYGIGGTIRTTLNLAEELVGRHEIEIVSIFKHRDDSAFDIDPRISLVPLFNNNKKSPGCELENPLHKEPAEAFPRNEARYKEYSKLIDQRVRDHYAASDADVVIGTRPGLVAYVSQFAPGGAVVIGQEHMTHNHHKKALREEMRPFLADLDAFVTVSEGDAAVWREHMPLEDTRILSIPNSVPQPTVAPSDLSGNLVVAAGRLSREKQYEILIKAFAKVAAKHPDWTLRMCGWGGEKDNLRRHILKYKLANQVQLMGPRSPIDPEWVKGAIAVSTSRHESFGMTLVEAMRNGLPVVSTDCNYGPREIITSGEDGLLVPVGKADAVARALLTLIEDEELRRRMGKAAIENSRRFDPGAVAQRYLDLFAELGAEDTTGRRAPAAPADSAAKAAPAAAEFAPVADCVAEADGSLTVTVVSPAPEDAFRTYPGLQLVCSRTRSDGTADERVYPFNRAGTVVIPADDEFAEGRWTCRAEHPATGRRAPLSCRSVDQRGSLRVTDRMAVDAGVRHLVAHRQAPAQHLALRSWVRPVHVEAGRIRRNGPDMILEGRVFGPVEPSGEPALVLRRRGDATDELVLPGTREGTRGFQVTLPGAALARRQSGEKDLWDVRLRFTSGHEPVRVGRLLDDVIQKGDVFVYPDALTHKPRPLLLARRALRKLQRREQRLVKISLIYGGENELLVRVTDR
ncbi:glycosyltransferase family 4 protein [Streptomyces clavuligerus]|uniref:glycosyltransferase family 4 protein n=7 Tax=Streptomyces clavuligerus TaxID=1901 RepID=UPI0001800193|nr:glycosyltransferase family 4 protein [Streptomyces clavuligerus]ANW20240.1 transferase [Streptomyces clavuligerus]AXU14864.1 glycosyltransferase family 4 protein [Streptomyces clavuligerus]EDY51904.1 transferase [Streptomyces clavuligerus]MBY6304902.1 glycosyltransferase family 4 protein [Streptomyces clavuligerus]QCS07636.1 glycosyltransferase family 4 protein [Streptomyces clavuligerus]